MGGENALLSEQQGELSLRGEALSLGVGRSAQLVLGKKLSRAKYRILAVLLRPSSGSTSSLEGKHTETAL